jgi:uncharacterized protein
MQDISLLNLHTAGNWKANAQPTGINVTDLAGYPRVVDWWFDTYGPYAVAAKTQAAYGRALDFVDVPAERAAPIFRRVLDGDPLDAAQARALDDHLFWYGVRRATAHNLPVKLHTGYYAGANHMPLGRLARNPSDVCELLAHAPDTTFVLMHICYPYQNEMVAIAKHWHNAVIDMCWAWIINPLASARFLEELLVTAPSTKVLTFGGDYLPVEPVVGHAAIARQGITQALSALVEDGCLTRKDAAELVDPIMRGNARRLFELDDKARALEQAPWLAAPAGASQT